MKTNYQSDPDYFLEKLALLERAKVTLKSEFIGIDFIIDEIISNVSAWFCFPELQEKPIVINLWGLTGVGKTSLINRLVELIDFKENYFRFDLGDQESNYSFKKSIEYLGKSDDKTPTIIAFDEFQHARTLNMDQSEITNDKNRVIWEIIDSGKITFIEWRRGLYSLADFTNKLNTFISRGLEIKLGYVVNFKRSYANEMGIDFTNDNDEIKVIPEYLYSTILESSNGHYNIELEEDIHNFVKEMSLQELIVFLDRLLIIGQSSITKYLTKSLIFILGNLDEAYNMSGNLNADIDADVFHEMSKEITIPQIKRALKTKFRNEQIARLGNIHIIYPALSKNNYKNIIELELNKFKINVMNQLGIEIEFHESVNHLIYKEGVYPTQGVRPIFTSLYQLVKSKIGEIYSEVISNRLEIDKIKLEILNNNLIVDYYFNKSSVHKKHLNLTLILTDLRKNKRDDMQAICAVHEAGHAILNVVLMQTLPEMIFSVTADSESTGFVYARYDWDYIAKNEFIPRVAVMLGGIVAEELVFGEENITLGSASDIDTATKFLMQHYMKSGVGEIPIKISQNPLEFGYLSYEATHEKVKELIIKAKELAKVTLSTEIKLLLEVADYLSEENCITQHDFLSLLSKHGTKYFPLNVRQNNNQYRKRLKELKGSLTTSVTDFSGVSNFISMNRDGL